MLLARAEYKIFYPLSTDYKCFQFIYSVFRDKRITALQQNDIDYIILLLNDFLEQEVSPIRKKEEVSTEG